MNKPLVIDIFHGDPVNDWAAVKAFGIVGVIHKASQGLSSYDVTYELRRRAATASGLLWGAYHFMSLEDPVKQAQHFLSTANPDDKTLLALDWENIPGTSTSPSAIDARAFLQEIEHLLGRKAVLYSGNVAKERIAGKDDYFASHKLWLCQYGPHWRTQASWKSPWLWQNNGDNSGPGPHHIPGISGLCDNNTIIDPMTVDDLISQWAS